MAAVAPAPNLLPHAKQVAYVLYAEPGPPLWHARWLLGMVATCPEVAVVVSPQGDVQVEVVDGTSPDITAVPVG